MSASVQSKPACQREHVCNHCVKHLQLKRCMIVIINSNVCFKCASFVALGANIPFWKHLTRIHEECVRSKAALRMFSLLLCNTGPILMNYCLENPSQGKSIKSS